METLPINYETSYKWSLSLGTFLLILSIGVLFLKEVTVNNLIVITIFVTLAVIMISQSQEEMKKIEDAQRRYNQELTVSEIIKQDLLLMEKEIKEMEYNNQITKWNKDNLEQKDYKEFRKIDLIIKQALDPYFYEKNLNVNGRGKHGK